MTATTAATATRASVGCGRRGSRSLYVTCTHAPPIPLSRAVSYGGQRKAWVVYVQFLLEDQLWPTKCKIADLYGFLKLFNEAYLI